MSIAQSLLTLLLVGGAFSFMVLRLVRVGALVNSGVAAWCERQLSFHEEPLL